MTRETEHPKPSQFSTKYTCKTPPWRTYDQRSHEAHHYGAHRPRVDKK